LFAIMRTNFFLMVLLIALPFMAGAQVSDSVAGSKEVIDSTLKKVSKGIYTMNGEKLSHSELVNCLFSHESSAKEYCKSKRKGFYQAGFSCLGAAGSILIAVTASNASPFIVDLIGGFAITGLGFLGYAIIAEDAHFKRAIRLYNEEVSKK